MDALETLRAVSVAPSMDLTTIQDERHVHEGGKPGREEGWVVRGWRVPEGQGRGGNDLGGLGLLHLIGARIAKLNVASATPVH